MNVLISLKRLYMAALAVTIAASSVGLAQAQDTKPAPPKIKILPINTATFIAGQKFDLRVEVSNVPEATKASTVTLTVDGKSPKEFFGKEISATNTTTSTLEMMVREVAFTAAGAHTVTAVYSDVKKSVSYTVLDVTKLSEKKAKNVIVFIGDGMAWPMLTIARLVSKGQTEGKYNGFLNMDKLEETGFVTTSGYDSIATDSANSASAYATGHKGVVNAMGVYEDNTASPFDDPRVENAAEVLKRSKGMAIGLVTTAEVEDATPAAFIAHTRRRGEKQFIADAFFAFKPEVLMGGGSAYFIPKATAGSKRTDERNLLDEFTKAGYALAGTRAEMSKVTTATKMLGLFHPANMNVYIDREQIKDKDVLGPYTDQPTLIEMTQKALDVLSANDNGKKNGFFLMVEGGSIDKELHPMDWERAAGDTIEMDKALGVAIEFQKKNPDTLIVVTADHAHSVSVYGTYDATKGPGVRNAVGVYNEAKFPTYKDEDKDGFPDKWDTERVLAVGFANQPDMRDDYLFNPKPIEPTVRDPNFPKDGRAIPNPEKDPKGILQEGNLPYGSDTEVHSVDDVPLFAQGPGARFFHGIHDNTEIFFGIMSSLGVDATK